MLYVVMVWFCLDCEVLFHCKNNRVCSLVLLAKRKEKKEKKNKPVGIKCFCILKDLDKADVFSVHEDANSLVKKGEHGCWVGLQGHSLMGYTGKMLESLI